VTRRVRERYCEALREGGLLILVFASLDCGFGVGEVSYWGVAGWNLAGAILLTCGIYLEPPK